MELKLSDKTLRKILIGVTIVAVILLIVNGLYRRSKYSFPPPTSSTNTYDVDLKAKLTACEGQYSTAVIGGTAQATAQTTLRTCVSSNVSAYVQNKCPYTGGQDPATMTPANGPFGSGAAAAWTAYNTNITSIRTAYASLLAAVDTTLTGDMVRAARKADLTGATRKYLSTVCPATSGPGFYTPADYGITTSTDATSGLTTFTQNASATYPDPTSSAYNTWQVYTTAPTATSTYGFYAANVTRQKVIDWYVGAGAFTAAADGTIPTVPTSGGAKYSNVGTNNIPNWVIARDFGPGTVGTNVPVSYAPASGAVVTANVTLPYTYA